MLQSPSSFSPLGIKRAAARTLNYLFADDVQTEVVIDLPIETQEGASPLFLDYIDDKERDTFYRLSRKIGRTIQYFPSLRPMLERKFFDKLNPYGNFYPNYGSEKEFMEHGGLIAFIPKIDIVLKCRDGSTFTLQKGSIVTSSIESPSLDAIERLFDERIGIARINEDLES